MRRIALPLALLLCAAVVGDAAAKEVEAVAVCGPSDCRSTRDRDLIGVVQNGGTPTIPPGQRAPSYRMRVRMRMDETHAEHFMLAFVPKFRMLRGGDREMGYTWTLLSKADARAWRALTRGIAPFPAKRLHGVGPAASVPEEPVAPTNPNGPASEPAASSDSGGSALPWIGGALVLLVALLGVLWRRRGLRWPRPTEG